MYSDLRHGPFAETAHELMEFSKWYRVDNATLSKWRIIPHGFNTNGDDVILLITPDVRSLHMVWQLVEPVTREHSVDHLIADWPEVGEFESFLEWFEWTAFGSSYDETWTDQDIWSVVSDALDPNPYQANRVITLDQLDELYAKKLKVHQRRSFWNNPEIAIHDPARLQNQQ